MENSIVEFAKNLAAANPAAAYIFFFFNSVLQTLFPPYPGDTIIVLEGYLSTLHALRTAFMLIATLSGTYLSSIFLYYISYNFGDKIISNKFIKKYFDIKKVHKLKKWFNKYGSLAIIINKFIPGIGSLTLIAAGIFKLQPSSAFVSIGIATLIHNTFLFMGGKITGDNMHNIKLIISQYTYHLIAGSVIIVILYLYVKFIYKKRSN